MAKLIASFIAGSIIASVLIVLYSPLTSQNPVEIQAQDISEQLANEQIIMQLQQELNTLKHTIDILREEQTHHRSLPNHHFTTDYDPIFDDIWQDNMRDAVQSDLADTKLDGLVNQVDYECHSDAMCVINFKTLDSSDIAMKGVNEYLLKLNQRPSVAHSGGKRIATIENVDVETDHLKVTIKIAQKTHH